MAEQTESGGVRIADPTIVPEEDARPSLEASLARSPEGAPSPVKTVKDMAQVMVDQWGHKGEFIKGQIIKLEDLNPAHYDHDHALRVGAIRMLTEAEARSLPTTFAANADGSLDLDHQAAMRFGAGIPDVLPETVTGESGPAEPAEFAKPTIPYTGDNAPSPRPIKTRKAGEEG